MGKGGGSNAFLLLGELKFRFALFFPQCPSFSCNFGDFARHNGRACSALKQALLHAHFTCTTTTCSDFGALHTFTVNRPTSIWPYFTSARCFPQNPNFLNRTPHERRKMSVIFRLLFITASRNSTYPLQAQ